MTLPPKQSSVILSDQPLSTLFNVEDLNIAEITAVYLENMMSSKDASNIVLELQLAIEKISLNLQYQSQPQSELIQTQSKSKSLTKALTEIKNHNSSLESKKLVESDIKSYKNDILKTLAVYKDYFSIKFSEDGNPINCDSDIKKILANFDEKGPLFMSINSSSDSKGIKDLRYELNGYLAILTILAESTIDNNPNDPEYSPDQKKQYVDAIKTSLLAFPGDATNTLQNDHNCVQGTRQRINNSILALKKLSQETASAKDYIDKISAQLAKKVRVGNQIHIPACLLGSLMMNGARIAQIDNFYTSPQKDISLHEIIDFSHSFNKEITRNLLDSRTAIIKEPVANPTS